MGGWVDRYLGNVLCCVVLQAVWEMLRHSTQGACLDSTRLESPLESGRTAQTSACRSSAVFQAQQGLGFSSTRDGSTRRANAKASVTESWDEIVGRGRPRAGMLRTGMRVCPRQAQRYRVQRHGGVACETTRKPAASAHDARREPATARHRPGRGWQCASASADFAAGEEAQRARAMRGSWLRNGGVFWGPRMWTCTVFPCRRVDSRVKPHLGPTRNLAVCPQNKEQRAPSRSLLENTCSQWLTDGL